MGPTVASLSPIGTCFPVSSYPATNDQNCNTTVDPTNISDKQRTVPFSKRLQYGPIPPSAL